MAMSMVLGKEEATNVRKLYTAKLPTKGGGWDSMKILAGLGQHDNNPRTDSDGSRCVQSVALAMRILKGSTATTNFLRALAQTARTTSTTPAQPRTSSGDTTSSRAAQMSSSTYQQTWRERRMAASVILDRIVSNIQQNKATYGHLWWAQEAMHSAVNLDDTGTPVDREMAALFPNGASLTHSSLNKMTGDPGEVVRTIGSEPNGNAIMLHGWNVVVNGIFDKLAEVGHPDADSDRAEVEIEAPDGTSRTVIVNRLTVPPKPTPNQLDNDRDSRSGHIMLLFKKDGNAYLYEPEAVTMDATTRSARVHSHGNHLFRATSSLISRFMHDQASFGLYAYMELFAKATL